MAQLLGIHVKNFKCLKDITLGKFSDTKEEALSNLTSLIGRNSSGKSSFFEVFSFISDCLKFGVEDACLVRGGLANLISKDTDLAEKEDQFNKTTSSTLIAEKASSTLNSSTLKSKSSPTDSASMSFEFCFKGRNDNEQITYSLSVGYHLAEPENKEHAEKKTKNNDAFKATSGLPLLEKPSQDLSSSYVRTTSARASLARSHLETSTSARTTFVSSPLTTSTSATSKLSTDVKTTSFSKSYSTSSKSSFILHESIIKTVKDKVRGSKDYILMHFTSGKGVILSDLYNEKKTDDASISSEKVKTKVSKPTSDLDLNITANPDRCGIESERIIEDESGIENVRDIGTDSQSHEYKEKYVKGYEVDPVSKSYRHIENIDIDVAESNQEHTEQCSKLEKTSCSNHHEDNDLHQEDTASDCSLNAAISNSAISNRTISNGEPVYLESSDIHDIHKGKTIYLEDSNHLAISSLDEIKSHPLITSIREFFCNSYLSSNLLCNSHYYNQACFNQLTDDQFNHQAQHNQSICKNLILPKEPLFKENLAKNNSSHAEKSDFNDFNNSNQNKLDDTEKSKLINTDLSNLTNSDLSNVEGSLSINNNSLNTICNKSYSSCNEPSQICNEPNSIGNDGHSTAIQESLTQSLSQSKSQSQSPATDRDCVERALSLNKGFHESTLFSKTVNHESSLHSNKVEHESSLTLKKIVSSSSSDNLVYMVQYIQREYSNALEKILKSVSAKLPDIKRIETENNSDGEVILKFFKEGFNEPFSLDELSAGTLKLLTYLLVLYDPKPYSLIFIEDPEDGLDPHLLANLVTELREYATSDKHQSQVFITTHSPYLVNALETDELWILEKGKDKLKGGSTISRASDNTLVKNLVNEGIHLGDLWYSGYLEKEQ